MKVDPKSGHKRRFPPVLTAILILLAVLCVLFARSFKPELLLFANDGPIGAVMARSVALPSGFQGIWQDLNWLGFSGGFATIAPSYLMMWWLTPLGFAKFYGALALFLLGLSAWTFFRQLGVTSALSVVGGIAAMLNMNVFSNTCWGLGTRALTLASAFLALALIIGKSYTKKEWWIKTFLAGICIGLGVVEGADVGAIFSVYIAVFIFFFQIISQPTTERKLGIGILQPLAVAAVAVVMAWQVIVFQNRIQIQDVKSSGQTESSEAKWLWATDWSLPPVETLRVIIPGLFGYRMDPEPPTPEGGVYWGRVGPRGMPRHSGSGEYAGVTVVLFAVWASVRSKRGNGVYNDLERRLILFWSVVAIVSVLFAFGRFVPVFYRLFHSLPYFNASRIPLKFLHPFHMAVLVLFGYGLLGLSRRYLEKPLKPISFSGWWAAAPKPDRRWVVGSLALVGLCFAGYFYYSSSSEKLIRYLTQNGFEPGMSASIAKFSVVEVGLYVLFLGLSCGLLILILRGTFAGPRAKWAAIVLGTLVVVDLGRANLPWIKYYDYKYKYATNPVLDFLRARPNEHRVTILPYSINREFSLLQQIHGIEWLQHHFQYYNIQSIDTIQMPREPADFAAYRGTSGVFAASNAMLQPRFWQLTNTRYILGLGGNFADALNQQFDPAFQRFRLHTAFDLVAKPGKAQPSEAADFTAILNPKGVYGLIEFTGALPRAKLYTSWQIATNDQQTMELLPSPGFDPAQAVIVAAETGLAPSASAGAVDAGQVEFVSYAPKRIALRAVAAAPAVLLLNDKWDANWKVRVDGQPAQLLRCNFLMRGVQVPAGTHQVVFSYEPMNLGLYVSLAAIAAALILCGLLVASSRHRVEVSGEIKPSPAAVTGKARKPKR